MRLLPGKSDGSIVRRWGRAGYRAFCIALSFCLVYSGSSLSLNAGALSFFGFIEQVFRQRPGPFSDLPRPIYRGADPRRDPRTRGGLWSEAALRDAA